MPLFSILHTSARPEKWREIYEAWLNEAVHPEQVEYVLCVDSRWGFNDNLASDQTLFAQWGMRPDVDKIVWNTGRRCYVDGVATAARAATGSVFIVNADDQYPAENWDAELLNVLVYSGHTSFVSVSENMARFVPRVDVDFVIEVSTGTPEEHSRGIMVMPILSRARYDKHGYVFYGQYESMFADNDFCEHARQDGVVIDARNLLFPHRHPINDPSVFPDGAYREQNRREAYRNGAIILEWRKRIRFGDEIDKADTIREGGTFKHELEMLSFWASQMETVIEVGSWAGRSAYAMAKGTTGQVHSVDTFTGSVDEADMLHLATMRGGSMLPTFLENTKDCPNIEVHVGDSVELAKYLPDADMVFIDGGHSYHQVKADLQAWIPKTRRLICGHDFDPMTPGVVAAVKEVLGDVSHFDRLWFAPLVRPLPAAEPAARKRSIVLCLPGEHFERRWVAALIRLYGHLILAHDFAIWDMFGYTSNVYATREEIRLMVRSLDPKPDLLLWLDDDNLVTPEQFDMLLRDLDGAPDIDGVTGWCWIHDDEKQRFNVSCGLWSPDHLHWRSFESRTWPKELEPRPVEVTGFPCFLMRYSALEKAGDSPFLPILDGRLRHGMTGEDLSFCLAAEKGGARFVADPRVRVTHLKMVEVEPVFEAEGAPEPIKFAAMLRVKNEARWIARAIESLKPLCGEDIFVFDDESSDLTASVAYDSGAHVFLDPFRGEPLDERRDKNWLLALVIERAAPDWVICIDGDEELEPGAGEKLKRAIQSQPSTDCYGLKVLTLWNDFKTIRTDGVYGQMFRQSVFRVLPGLEFRGFYEGSSGAVCHSGLHTSNSPLSLQAVPLNVFLLHYGYVFKEDRVRKWRWYSDVDPYNETEDHYRHTVQGDVPEVPAEARLKHAGPLELRTLPARLVPRFKVSPGPLVEVSDSDVLV
jgi:hypothetical protein